MSDDYQDARINAMRLKYKAEMEKNSEKIAASIKYSAIFIFATWIIIMIFVIAVYMLELRS